MRYPLRVLSSVGGRRIIIVIGGLYVALSVIFALFQTAGTIPFGVVVIVSLLTAAPGAVLLYGGYRLPMNDIHPDLEDHIAGWCLGGIGVIAGILALTVLVSGITNIVHNFLILTALGSVAGFGMGVYDAQARTRAREAEQRSRELAHQNRQLESFAEMLAHELRNPLTIAKGYHQQSQPHNEDAAQEVVLAHERIEKMIKLLLLTIRGSKIHTDHESVAISEVATKAWDELSIRTESTTLIIDTEHAIRGDPVHIRHLLANLFRNSIEHGEEEVTVRIGNLEDGFYVEDDGPGIPEDDHNRVFKAGFTTKSNGMGLGLTAVIQLAELYDWDLTLTDIEDGGTRFEFSKVDLVTKEKRVQHNR